MGGEGQMDGGRFPAYTKFQAWVSALWRGTEPVVDLRAFIYQLFSDLPI